MTQIINDIEKIKMKVNIYSQIAQTTSEKRRIWEAQKKEQVFSVLERIKRDTSFDDVNIIKADLYSNYGGVFFQLKNQPSGISATLDNGGFQNFVKNGAALAFSQSFNGDILVVITYPQIEKITSGNNSKLLGRISPIEITEQFISEKVDQFLDEIIKWEQGDQKEPAALGFFRDRSW